MRDWRGTLEWYRNHQTAGQIGFDPDGMCLKVCRTARDIGSKYLTAKQAQDATPAAHRVSQVGDLRRGMVLYFDTVGDSNPYGHIVTMIGRVKGGNKDSLDDILVETNSVVSNEVVVVRASYFGQHWGDKFQFGATILNGVELDVPAHKDPTPPKPKKKVGTERLDNFRKSGPEWDVKILDRVADQGRRDIVRQIRLIETYVKALPTDQKDTRVKEFVEHFEKHRVLKMALLNAAVADGRMARVKTYRDRLRQAIKKVNTL